MLIVRAVNVGDLAQLHDLHYLSLSVGMYKALRENLRLPFLNRSPRMSDTIHRSESPRLQNRQIFCNNRTWATSPIINHSISLIEHPVYIEAPSLQINILFDR